MKKITLLGSTGSIGVNSLRVIKANPEKYKVVALAAGRNIDLLLKQIDEFAPEVVCVSDKHLASRLRDQIPGTLDIEVLSCTEGVIRLATLDKVDTIISAMTGAVGLLPTYEAIRAGKDIALANKETMVMAGPLVMEEARKRGVSILPIDSEHSAILQSLQGHEREELRRVILTASGGPFKDMSTMEMSKVTPAQALDHPNWSMGPKISVDSATMMNKGLEAIEAKWFFDLEMDQISILIHPQSIIHSMVEYLDGSIIAQIGTPDMIIPISYALSFPSHLANTLSPLELDEIGMLSFEKPAPEKFRCIDLAITAAEIGKSMPAVLNAANEIAVSAFLEGKTGFLEISNLIEKTMEMHKPYPVVNIEAVLEADTWARETARQLLTD